MNARAPQSTPVRRWDRRLFLGTATLGTVAAAILLVTASPSAHAAPAQRAGGAARSTGYRKVVPTDAGPRFSTEFRGESSAQAPEDIDHSARLVMQLEPAYQFKGGYRLSLRGGGYRLLTDGQDVDFTDPEVTFRHLGVRPYNDWLILAARGTATAGASRASRLTESAVARVEGGPRFGADLGRAAGMRGLGVYYDFLLHRSFHQYTTTVEEVPNVGNRVINGVGVAYAPTFIARGRAPLRARMDLSHSVGWTYVKNREVQSYAWSEEVAFFPTPELGLSVGHVNSGDIVKPDGKTSNFSFASERGSQFYGAVEYAY